MKRASMVSVVVGAAGLALVGGCDKKETGAPSRAPTGATGATAPAGAAPATGAGQAALPATLFLTSAPADAKTVEEVKAASVKPGDTVTVRGRIGGDVKPFVEDRAVFTIVGPGIPSCSDNKGDMCKTPWDYCCETKEDIAEHMATVQVVDASGKAALRVGFEGLNGLKGLSEVIVVGTVAEVSGPVLVVNATGIHRVN
ncbi:MAG: hypothetical protein WD749_14300 [Phycisphaerales bacterium]